LLFVAAIESVLYILTLGHPVRDRRVVALVNQADHEGFGACTNHGECEAACPKEIRLEFIARLNRDYLRAQFTSRA
jgi:succinate dehydrogenase / fumarate reductase iron-sulfur subunit